MRRTTRTFIALTLLALLVGPSVRAEGEAEKSKDARHPTSVIAWVNDEPILYGEIIERVGAALRRLANPDPRERVRLEDDTVVDLITQRLILGAATRMKLILSERSLDLKVEAERKRIERSGQTFDSYLDERGVSFDGFRRFIKEQLTVGEFMKGQLGLRRSLSAQDRPEFDIGVSPREAREWHLRHRERFKQPADVRLSTINIAVVTYLSIGGGVTPDEAVAKATAAADEVRRKLAAGEAFEDLAREYSHASHKNEGGDNGRQELSALAPALRDPVAATAVGSVGSAVLRRRNVTGTERIVMHVIFRVDERREARVAPFSDPETQKLVFNELRQEKYRRAHSKIVMALARDASIKPKRYDDMLLERHRRELSGK